MKFKQKLAYMTLGGLLVFMGQLLSLFINNVTAQNQPLSAEDVTFEKVKCRSLEIIDGSGKVGCKLFIDDNGGVMIVYGKDKGAASVFTDAYGGAVTVHGKSGGLATAQLRNTENGGTVGAYGKGEGYALLYNLNNGGAVGVHGKSGKERGFLGVDELDDGQMMLFNRNSKARIHANMGLLGGGSITTWGILGGISGIFPDSVVQKY